MTKCVLWRGGVDIFQAGMTAGIAALAQAIGEPHV